MDMPNSSADVFSNSTKLSGQLAAVDLGSNSFHLIVAQVSDGQLHIIDRLRETVRLAGGLDLDTKVLAEQDMNRGLHVWNALHSDCGIFLRIKSESWVQIPCEVRVMVRIFAPVLSPHSATVLR